jgi:hypothetical protein
MKRGHVAEVMRNAAIALESLYQAYKHEPSPEAVDLIQELRGYAVDIDRGATFD